MKRFVALCLLWLALSSALVAQNPVFRKYADMDKVKFVSIGKSMLEQMARSGKSSIGGIDIRGLGPNTPFSNILIISSAEPAITRLIKEDETTLSDSSYTNMVITQDGNQSRSAIYYHEDDQKVSKQDKRNELVMFVTDGPEMTVIVLTGCFTQHDVERMFL